jgi:hypothetical protein
MLRIISLVVLFTAAVAPADTIYVNATLGSDAWDGRCEYWDGQSCGPKATIQAGIDAAAEHDEVLVAEGIYSGPGNRDLDLYGKALTLRAAGGEPGDCVIDCEHSGRAFYFHSGEGADSIVAGFLIRHADGDAGTIYCYGGASPTLVDCTITNNTANNGGGLFCDEGSRPTLTRCVIANNLANCGGGVACKSYSDATLVDCTVADNLGAYGAVVWCSDHSNVTHVECIISGNGERAIFGAVWTATIPIRPLINCVISGNSTT